jgi:hypothetical protein
LSDSASQNEVLGVTQLAPGASEAIREEENIRDTRGPAMKTIALQTGLRSSNRDPFMKLIVNM